MFLLNPLLICRPSNRPHNYYFESDCPKACFIWSQPSLYFYPQPKNNTTQKKAAGKTWNDYMELQLHFLTTIRKL